VLEASLGAWSPFLKLLDVYGRKYKFLIPEFFIEKKRTITNTTGKMLAEFPC
jgi:hypothetical protein